MQGYYGDPLALIDQALAEDPHFVMGHAQRDLLHLTLLEAAARANQKNMTLALAAERMASKRRSPFNQRFLRRAMEMHSSSAAH